MLSCLYNLVVLKYWVVVVFILVHVGCFWGIFVAFFACLFVWTFYGGGGGGPPKISVIY